MARLDPCTDDLGSRPPCRGPEGFAQTPCDTHPRRQLDQHFMLDPSFRRRGSIAPFEVRGQRVNEVDSLLRKRRGAVEGPSAGQAYEPESNQRTVEGVQHGASLERGRAEQVSEEPNRRLLHCEVRPRVAGETPEFGLRLQGREDGDEVAFGGGEAEADGKLSERPRGRWGLGAIEFSEPGPYRRERLIDGCNLGARRGRQDVSDLAVRNERVVRPAGRVVGTFGVSDQVPVEEDADELAPGGKLLGRRRGHERVIVMRWQSHRRSSAGDGAGTLSRACNRNQPLPGRSLAVRRNQRPRWTRPLVDGGEHRSDQAARQPIERSSATTCSARASGSAALVSTVMKRPTTSR